MMPNSTLMSCWLAAIGTNVKNRYTLCVAFLSTIISNASAAEASAQHIEIFCQRPIRRDKFSM